MWRSLSVGVKAGTGIFPERILSIPECFAVVIYNRFKPSLKCLTSELIGLILI